MPDLRNKVSKRKSDAFVPENAKARKVSTGTETKRNIPAPNSKVPRGKKADTLNQDASENDDMKKQLKKLQNEYDALLDDLKTKTELIIELTEKVDSFEKEDHSSKKEVSSKQIQTNFDCFCENVVEDIEEFECDDCGFDTIFKEQFDWHMSDNHGWPKPNEEESDFEFTCNICEGNFETKRTLMNHRKEIHIDTIKLCKYFLEERCEFPDSVCWFRHDYKEKEKVHTQVIKCGLCVKTFKTQFNLMYHRKESHEDIV